MPALLIRTPYNREEGAESWLRYVCRGYALVIQDVRGKGESTGAWVPHSYEVEDGTATLELVTGYINEPRFYARRAVERLRAMLPEGWKG